MADEQEGWIFRRPDRYRRPFHFCREVHDQHVISGYAPFLLANMAWAGLMVAEQASVLLCDLIVTPLFLCKCNEQFCWLVAAMIRMLLTPTCPLYYLITFPWGPLYGMYIYFRDYEQEQDRRSQWLDRRQEWIDAGRPKPRSPFAHQNVKSTNAGTTMNGSAGFKPGSFDDSMVE